MAQEPCGCQNITQMLVTAVITTINEEKYLPDCLDSLLNQTRPPDEVIIVDGGSTDNTTQIAENYNCVIVNAPLGKLTQRHIGFQKATGDIVLGCDADTTYPPDYVEKMVTPIENGNAVATKAFIKENSPVHIFTIISNSIQDVVTNGKHLPGAANAIHKQTYFDTGGFNLDAPQGAAADGNNTLGTGLEEEIKFPERLSQHGNIQQVESAVLHSDRAIRGESKVFGDITKKIPETIYPSLAAAALSIATNPSNKIHRGAAAAALGFAAGEIASKITHQNTVIDTFKNPEQATLTNNASLKQYELPSILLGIGALIQSPELLGLGTGYLAQHLAKETLTPTSVNQSKNISFEQISLTNE